MLIKYQVNINEDLMVLRLALYYSHLFNTIKRCIVRFNLKHNYPFHFHALQISAKILIYFEVRAYGIYINKDVQKKKAIFISQC